MAKISGFFNSSNGDRAYDASFFAEYNTIVNSNGVDLEGSFNVTNSGLDLVSNVAAGKSFINGYFFSSNAVEVLTHANANASNDRIDRVILRLDLNASERNIDIYIKDGVPSSQPEPPALTRTEFVWELSLAQVRVPANVVAIPQANITIEVLDVAACGLISYVGQLEISAEEVKGLYESNSDTNAFGDDEESKLSALPTQYNGLTEINSTFTGVTPITTIVNSMLSDSAIEYNVDGGFTVNKSTHYPLQFGVCNIRKTSQRTVINFRAGFSDTLSGFNTVREFKATVDGGSYSGFSEIPFLDVANTFAQPQTMQRGIVYNNGSNSTSDVEIDNIPEATRGTSMFYQGSTSGAPGNRRIIRMDNEGNPNDFQFDQRGYFWFGGGALRITSEGEVEKSTDGTSWEVVGVSIPSIVDLDIGSASTAGSSFVTAKRYPASGDLDSPASLRGVFSSHSSGSSSGRVKVTIDGDVLYEEGIGDDFPFVLSNFSREIKANQFILIEHRGEAGSSRSTVTRWDINTNP